MNHVPSQHGRLTAQLKKECRELQAKGYYGDGESFEENTDELNTCYGCQQA